MNRFALLALSGAFVLSAGVAPAQDGSSATDLFNRATESLSKAAESVSGAGDTVREAADTAMEAAGSAMDAARSWFGGASEEDAAATAAALKELETTTWQVWASGDAEAYAGYFAAPALYLNSEGVITGVDNLVAYDLDPACTDRSFTLGEIAALPLSDSAWALIYDVRYQETCDGMIEEGHALATSIFGQRAGAWKNVYYSEITPDAE